MNGAPVASVASVASVGSLADTLDNIRTWFSRYLVTMRDDDLDVLALWTLHTWLCQETYTSPRLLIDSPVPGSGKTTLLEHLGKLCCNPVQMASVSSPALLVRIVATGIRTLLIDEVDRSLDPKRPGVQDLIAVLNSGYKVGGTRPVLTSGKQGAWDVDEMPTFAPVAIAGNTPLLPDDTRSRCIVVRLMPDRDGKAEYSDWEWIDEPANELAAEIQAIVEQVRDQVRTARPDLPPGCANRNRERWNPLAKIAFVAGGTWVEKVNDLITADLALAAEAAENGEVTHSPTVQLMHDLFGILGDNPRFELSTEIVRQLIKRNPEQWSFASPFGKDLTTKRLGSLLNRGYGIYSQRLDANSRGWHTNQFRQIWQRLGIITQAVSDPTDPTNPTEPTTELELL